MIVKATETILKDGGHIYMIRLGGEKEESASEWKERREAIAQAIPSLIPTVRDDGQIVLTLQLLPQDTAEEFTPGNLSEADLIRELGAIDSKQPGQVNKTSAKYEGE